MPYGEKDIAAILALKSDEKDALTDLSEKALGVMKEEVGTGVFYRGIIEFSNICRCNCRYCGIRRDNHLVTSRYTLTKEEIVSAALLCARLGYGSIVLQSGERRDPAFIDFVENLIVEIKDQTRSEKLPRGLGITLGIGEQSQETYRRLFRAGAHRYLLRIETSDLNLFRHLHPAEQTLKGRIHCLEILREEGYLVGTGVMIGIPGQSLEMLARDILFFKKIDVDMIGMGPYIIHPEGDMTGEDMMERGTLLQLSLNMIAVTRLVLRNVNIAATTALHAIAPDGRERGLSYGANVTMPNLTPVSVRKGYQLYAGKPGVEKDGESCGDSLLKGIKALGREVVFNQWGDVLDR